MTTQRFFKCNLCSDQVSPSRAKGAVSPGIGLSFQANDNMHIQTIHDAENHICLKCLRSLLVLVSTNATLKKEIAIAGGDIQ